MGNLNARRDWGHARDYVEGMWMMLQQPRPDDYVLATGDSHTVREFVERAFAAVGRTISWRGEGTHETGIDKANGQELVKVDPRYFRPTEVDVLIGDASKAQAALGWRHRVTFDALVTEMVEEDRKTLRGGAGRSEWRE
jgi:GDPmannose 4,6-dehydratase